MKVGLYLFVGPALLQTLGDLLLHPQVGCSGSHSFLANDIVKKCVFEELISLSIFQNQFRSATITIDGFINVQA
jgi:hypothetical protein